MSPDRMTRHAVRIVPPAAVLMLCAVTSCSESPRPGSFIVQLVTHDPAGTAGGGPSHLLDTGDSAIVAFGRDTLILRNAELVVHELALAPFSAGECEEEEEKACATVQGGLAVVRLPLGAAAESVFATSAPPDTYSLVQLGIQAPDSVRDQAFLSAHQDLAHTSVRIRGTFSRSGERKDFVYTSDFSERQELPLAPPVTLGAGETKRLTLRIDVARWFLSADKTALIDPATANWGQPNENLVKDNIRTSLGMFRDDNRDGRSDDDPIAAP